MSIKTLINPRFPSCIRKVPGPCSFEFIGTPYWILLAKIFSLPRAASLDGGWLGHKISHSLNAIGNIVSMDVGPHISSVCPWRPAPDRDDGGRAVRGQV